MGKFFQNGKRDTMNNKVFVFAVILAVCFFSNPASAQTFRMVLERLEKIEGIIDELDSNQKTELESLKSKIGEISGGDISAVTEVIEALKLQVEKLEQEVERISAETAELGEELNKVKEDAGKVKAESGKAEDNGALAILSGSVHSSSIYLSGWNTSTMPLRIVSICLRL